MKPLIILLLPLLASCGYTRYAPPTDKKVTVQYVLRNPDGSGEVWAVWQSRYKATYKAYYMAEFKAIPDSLKPGKVLNLSLKMPQNDTCNCITFKIVKK